MFVIILSNVTPLSSFRGSLIARRCLSYKPIAFYTIKPLAMPRVQELKSKFQADLQKLDVKGRIYIAPESGIGGINCQMAVPTTQIRRVKSYFNDLHDIGPIQFNEGILDTAQPSFSKLRVLIKRNVRENVLTKLEQTNRHLFLVSRHSRE